ncbi:hypothetical protein AVEN_221554-1, partial [Araneus ventricosus]
MAKAEEEEARKRAEEERAKRIAREQKEKEVAKKAEEERQRKLSLQEDQDDFEDEPKEPAAAPTVRTSSVGVPTPLLQAATTAKNASPEQTFQYTPPQPPPEFE